MYGLLVREEKDANYQATRDIGKLGIERYYEDMLELTLYQEVEVNSRGRVIPNSKIYSPSVPGKDIVLNLDIKLQTYVLQTARRTQRLSNRSRSKRQWCISDGIKPKLPVLNTFVHGISSLKVTTLYCRIKIDLWLTGPISVTLSFNHQTFHCRLRHCKRV